jgi:hypothetical protein
MKVYQVLEILQNLGADDDVFCPIFLKEEADERGEQNLDQVDFRLEGSVWAKIVSKLESDDYLWQSLNETFFDYVEEALEKVEANATN